MIGNKEFGIRISIITNCYIEIVKPGTNALGDASFFIGFVLKLIHARAEMNTAVQGERKRSIEKRSRPEAIGVRL